MAGDYTRFTFNPLDDYASVLMQQGRVQLDADLNELAEILDRHLRAETVDVIGRGVVPKETPDGFKIELSGGAMTIGRGRIYVDGLLAENHGKQPRVFDSVLGEVRGTLPVPYIEQPYLPNPPALPQGGPHLVYLDVWHREVTALEDPDLIEKAVGIDTATRLQTVWQVKVLPNIGPNVTCATPDSQIPGWLDVIRPSAGRLTTTALGQPSSNDPCIIPPNGGFRGTENRLYRVEIHEPGAQGTATFKWSRDNGSIATTVKAIDSTRTQLAVVRTGRGSVLRFNAGDWVEVTDDVRELAGLPGVMRKVQSVDDVNLAITLTTALPAGMFPTSGPDNLTDLRRHTRVQRWDQKGLVRDSNGNVIADMDASGGVITVPAAATIVLEDGVQITLTTDPVGGQFRVGDYWVFAARTTDASIELLQQAPPRGIHHHYARLAIATFPNTVTDCRRFWPPDVPDGGCDCTICVSTESHNSGVLTIQRAIDQVKSNGGKICLGPGIYNLGRTPIRIQGAQSIHLQGHGWKTILFNVGSDPAIVIENSMGVTVEALTILRTGPSSKMAFGVDLKNNIGVTLQRCVFLQSGSRESTGPAIGVGGFLLGTIIRENVLIAATGVEISAVRPQDPATAPGEPGPQPRYLMTWGLYVQDNFFWCNRNGISLEGFSLHAGDTNISGNSMYGCSQGGIVAGGLVLNLVGSRMDIRGNALAAQGDGIVVGVAAARICSNDISAQTAGQGRDGIVLATGLNRTGIDHCQVLGNRITGVGGHGIAIRAHVRSAMIKQNIIEGVGGGGVVMEDNSSADGLSIENNQLLNIAPQANDQTKFVVGIRLMRTNQAEVAGNTIRRLGVSSVQSPSRVGIQVVASSSMRIAGNEMIEIGPPADFVNETAGVEVLASFDRVDVVDNVIRRSQTPPQNPGAAKWYALHVKRAPTRIELAGAPVSFVSLGPLIFAFLGNQVQIMPRGRQLVAVRGNLLESYGGIPLVDISGDGACVFSDNRCLLAFGPDVPGGAPIGFPGGVFPGIPTLAIIVIAAGAVISGGNYMEGPRGLAAMRLFLPQGPQSPQGPFTVLGNIASGDIIVNNSVLAAPWAPLNVIVP